MILTFSNFELQLLPEKAVFSAKEGALFIADTHFGKTSTFRKAGIPVPEGSLEHDLLRIDSLIDKYSVSQVFFLGDLFHSDLNQEWDAFSQWRKSHPSIDMTLVVGNHDILSHSDYAQASLHIEQEPFFWNDIELRHHPKEDVSTIKKPVLCGHVHPGVRVTSSGKFNETLPCFLLRGMQLTLPAFGSFTGLGSIHPRTQDRIFILGEVEIFEIGGV